MSIEVLLLAMLAEPASGELPQPYTPVIATEEGAKLTVQKLFVVAKDQDGLAFDKVARGIVIFLAPDMAYTLDRTKFNETFAVCTAPLVVSARPFPKIPNAEAVRIEMTCKETTESSPIKAVADVMADNVHAMMIFPGGVEQVWPKAGGRRGND